MPGVAGARRCVRGGVTWVHDGDFLHVACRGLRSCRSEMVLSKRSLPAEAIPAWDKVEFTALQGSRRGTPKLTATIPPGRRVLHVLM
jgi:hypothetical protein